MDANKQQMKELGRLKKRSDFLHVQAGGLKCASKGLILQVSKNNNLGRRYGLTVSRKLSKSAVERNRIRRRLRSVVCDILPKYALDNTDYVLIGRNGTAKRLYTDLQSDLKWCLKKLDFNSQS